MDRYKNKNKLSHLINGDRLKDANVLINEILYDNEQVLPKDLPKESAHILY